MTITFHGAAQNVTGSKHLIEFNGKRILLDCGLFQGPRSEVRDRNSQFPFDPQSIDAVVLSHAHLDHCGMLPLLVKQGFRGKIYSTPATRDVAKHMLLDSAGIQESDFKYLKKKSVSGHKRNKPLYTKNDIPPTMRRFEPHAYERSGGGWKQLYSGINLKFYDAGHILGSAVTVIELQNKSKKFRIGYTGDLGRRHAALLHNPRYIKEKIDVLISESTYGAHHHQDARFAYEKLEEIIKRIAEKKSKLIIPAFSLGRTQEVVYTIHRLTDTGKIPRIPIYVDSPLAGRVTQVFRKYREDYDLESKLDFPRAGDVPLAFRNLKYTKDRNESIKLNHTQGPFVVISASGMAEGGRVLHHLKNSLRSGNNTVLFTGYQAQGTLGRRLLEGMSPVRIFGRLYRVNAQIEVINELSAHADGDELMDYITHCKGLKEVFLVHGETDRSGELKSALAKRAPKLDIRIPQHGEKFEFLV